MVTLEQIRRLESKVSQIVATVKGLREENTTLRQKLETYQERIDQLELLVAQYRDSQKEIEEGILNALQQLDRLEDNALTASPSSAPISEDIEGKPIIPLEETDEAENQEKKTGELDIF